MVPRFHHQKLGQGPRRCNRDLETPDPLSPPKIHSAPFLLPHTNGHMLVVKTWHQTFFVKRDENTRLMAILFPIITAFRSDRAMSSFRSNDWKYSTNGDIISNHYCVSLRSRYYFQSL